MIIVTSLSGSHSNAANQKTAVDSWQQFGECYSLNCKNEIEILEPLYPNITFIETDKTIEHLVGKPLVSVWSMMQFAKGRNEDLLLVNSDIVILRLPELKEDGITLFSRYDYNNYYTEGTLFPNGFDAFYIPNKLLNLFPFSIYSLGACYHDYVLALIAIEKKIPVYYPDGKFCFHKIHEVHYSFQEYLDLGEYFRWHFKLSRSLTIPQVAQQSLAKIKENLISY